MTHVDLFSGIGGFALACRWAGIETIQMVEIDPFCQAVLRKNFAGVPIWDDIKTFAWTGDNPFILTGGFPCQPFSCAGKRRGKEDDRFIWPEMVRVISEARPTWVLGENVAGFVGMGLDQCISDLEGIGYEVQPLIIPACAVNAPHRRDRVWIIAHANNAELLGHGEHGVLTPVTDSNGAQDRLPKQTDSHAPYTNRAGNGTPQIRIDTNGATENQERIEFSQFRNCRQDRHAADTGNKGLEIRKPISDRETTNRTDKRQNGIHWTENWYSVALRTCVRGMDDGTARRVDRNRVNRLKSLGNAIVPQVAYQIIKAIVEVTQ